MGNSIKEDIDRCKELIKDTHKEWIGISNQVAIESVLRRLEQDEKIIREMAKYIAEHTTASIDNYGASAEEWEKYFRKRCGVDE